LGDTDGIVELWFDNINGFNAFANSPSYLNVIKLDEERFTDPKKCEYFFSEERTIINEVRNKSRVETAPIRAGKEND
jgi:hypothetical protein